MPFRLKSMVKEVGAAFAVLALYILVLLAPLHQAAGLQRDLAELGYATLDTWSVCAPLEQDRQDGETVAKCAAAGIGKNEIAPVELPTLAVGQDLVASTFKYAAFSFVVRLHVEQHPGIPRAPPAIV
jgi:hypothetical protein